MSIEKLKSDYDKLLEELARASIREFIESIKIGVDPDDDYFHPERAGDSLKNDCHIELSKFENDFMEEAELLSANDALDWTCRVRRKLGLIKIDMIKEYAQQGLSPENIAEETKIPVETIIELLEVLKTWSNK